MIVEDAFVWCEKYYNSVYMNIISELYLIPMNDINCWSDLSVKSKMDIKYSETFKLWYSMCIDVPPSDVKTSEDFESEFLNIIFNSNNIIIYG